MAVETILRNKSGHAVLGYDEATATLSRLAQDGSLAGLVSRDGASNSWKLDEMTGLVAKDALGGKDGTISGAVTLGTPGATPGGTAMTFDAASGKILTAAVSLPVTCTVELWLKTTSASGQTAAVNLRPTAQFLVAVENGVVIAWTGGAILAGVRPVNDNRWHHVVVVFAATQCTIYVDGTVDTTGADSHTLLSAPLRIGRDETTSVSFNGSLDEVSIYPLALTPAQIAQHYLAGRGVADAAVEPVCWNKSGDPVLGYLEPTDALVVLAGGGVVSAPAVLAPRTYDALIRRDAPSNYWRLDEATGLLARDSVGGKDGTVSGGVTLNQPGAMLDSNTAMRFDGATGKVVTAANVSILTPFTLELWVRSSLLAAQPLFSTRNGAADSGNFVLITDATGLLYLYQTGNGGTSQTAKSVADGRWHHVALVVTNTATPVFYIDGIVSIAGALPGAFGTGSATHLAEIGADSGGPGFWNGLLDEIAIYPVALTPAQIAQHYAAGYGVFPTVEPVLRSKSGHAVLGYNESTDQLSVLCQGTL